MFIAQESGCASGMDCFQNLNSSLKNQKSEIYLEFNGQVLVRQG